MTIYEQLDKMLNESDRPTWADEILFELREIKTMLKNSDLKRQKPKKDREYFKFVDELRKKLRADIIDGNYPEIYYDDKVFGINFKGFIYDKETSNTISAHKAFEIYRFLYKNRENLDNFIKF